MSEFLLGKFNQDSDTPATQVEVLSCLFIIVGKYGLEMDNFYESLEKMISKRRSPSKSLFKLKNSRRFLKLVESAMKSSRVPFKSIVTLTKLIIAQTFKEESEFSFWALSFFINLVKKYALAYLRHRQLQNHLSEFPEIEALKSHYSPRVRSLLGELSKDLNKS